MRKTASFKKFFSLCACLGFLLGCSNTVSQSSEASIGNKEFNFNYAFLYYYYYKADEELQEPSAYVDNPLALELPAKYADIADVYLMYSSMSDLMTRYYPHEYFTTVNTAISQSTTDSKSFGMELSESLAVKTVYREGPAASAGIRKGDVVRALDETELDGNDSLYAAMLSAKAEDTFLFSIQRGSDTLSLYMTRTALLKPSVYLDSIGEIPVIRVTTFMGTTNGFRENGSALEFEDALEKTSGAKATVLDLRQNGGGSLDLCGRMAADVLSMGDTVFVEKKWGIRDGARASREIAYTTESDGIGAKRYYVLMLDSGSASCSELFAAAISSNLKAPIVGTNSYGKGIGQLYVATPDSGYGVATSSLFYDKDGQTYHSYGFEPDFFVPDEDSALAKAVELAEEGTAKRTAGYSTQVQPFWKQVKKKSSQNLSPEESIQQLKKGMALRVRDYTLFDFDR